MMIDQKLIDNISAENFNMNYYVNACSTDSDLRETLIHLMLNHIILWSTTIATTYWIKQVQNIRSSTMITLMTSWHSWIIRTRIIAILVLR